MSNNLLVTRIESTFCFIPVCLFAIFSLNIFDEYPRVKMALIIASVFSLIVGLVYVFFAKSHFYKKFILLQVILFITLFFNFSKIALFFG